MSRVFAPSFDIDLDTWSPVGDSALHLCLDEGVSTPDDATTYVHGDAEGSVARVGLSTISPPPAVGPGHKLRVRARRDPVIYLNPATLRIKLVNGNLGVTIFEGPSESLTGSFQTFEYDLSLVDPLSQYSSLEIQLINAGTPPARHIWVTAVELEVPSEVDFDGSSSSTTSQSSSIQGLGIASGSSTATTQHNAFVSGIHFSDGSSSATTTEAAAATALIVAAPAASSAQTTQTCSATGVGVLVVSSSIQATQACAIQGLAHASGSSQASTSGTAIVSGIGFVRNLAGVVRLSIEASLTMPVVHDNEPDLASTSSWARASIDSIEVKQIGAGRSNLYRYSGRALIDIRTSIDLGENAGLIGFEELVSTFSQKTVATVNYRSPSIVGKVRIGDDWIIEVALEFWVDHDEPVLANSPGRPSMTSAMSTIRTHFRTNVAGPLNLHLLSDNQPMTQELPSVWCRLSWKADDSQRADSVTIRTFGIMEARTFCTVDVGDSQLLDIAQQILDTMKCVTLSGVTLKSPSIRTVGRRGSWWQLNVSCPLFFDSAA